ncbi:hypothetical protein Tsubulata_021667 [Turnera subulata]|uniref:Ionotropic glutamate receptor C-terminal domain-containing protein n=1 Tax=Turnera subulata TaxID=218843 RepID=A0A9Q0FH43_9ROSI|nr:hypothetical protein Tsubulata_021667 [Turnera subulata]
MYPSLGKRLFNKAKELGMMSKGYVWLMSDGMTGFLGSSTCLHIESLQGASGVKTYVPKAKELENYRVPWKTKFLQDNLDEVDVELRNYGLWAYDATVALAVAVGQIAATANHGFQKANVSISSATELDTPGVSRNGQNLLKALANISFKGLSGDSTLPFTESGVSMVVPIVDSKTKNAWVFFKPLTWDLWVTSFCFFIFIGFVVWVLEHRVNEEFRGPPSYQAGTSFWFSFSTMVFAQKEKVVSNLGRTVVIIWFFVVLILTQSYTASLTSLLTVQNLQPTVTVKRRKRKRHKDLRRFGQCYLRTRTERAFTPRRMMV